MLVHLRSTLLLRVLLLAGASRWRNLAEGFPPGSLLSALPPTVLLHAVCNCCFNACTCNTGKYLWISLLSRLHGDTCLHGDA